MESIRSLFEQVVPLSEEDWQYFSSKLQRHTAGKGACLLQAGQTENYLSFLEKGSVRFVRRHNDQEQTFGFAFELSFVSAYDSFLTQTPSLYFLETMAQTVLWRLSYADLQLIYKHTAAGNRIGRWAGEDLYVKKAARELSLLHETAAARYLHLLLERPQLLQYIPLKYIASYIGVTPQALSRIRSRIS